MAIERPGDESLRDVAVGVAEVEDAGAALAGGLEIDVGVPVAVVGDEVLADVDEAVADAVGREVVGDDARGE